MAKIEDKQVLVRLPVTLVKRLDGEAKKQDRTRAAEIRIRLADSLKSKRSGAAA